MAILGLMFRAFSRVGYSYISPICCRFMIPLHQQSAGAKSIESKLGLPEKPRRPMAAFFEFAKDRRPKIVAENPKLTVTEVMKKLSEEWKVCDPLTKRQYIETNQKNAREYGAALEKYHLSLSKEDAERIREAKTIARKGKAARAHKRKLKELNKPKRPPNAFLLFLMQETANGTFKGLTTKERMKKAGELWKAVPESLAFELKCKAEESYRRYQLELDTWEELMVSKGYVDVVYESKPKKKEA